MYDPERHDAGRSSRMWHGQHYLTPFLSADEHRVQSADLAPSRRRDQCDRRRASRRRRPSAAPAPTVHDFSARAASSAFQRNARRAGEGYNIALTADVPKVSRVAGLGIVKLAQHSGRPIYPAAIATSSRITTQHLGSFHGQPAVRPRRRSRVGPIYVARRCRRGGAGGRAPHGRDRAQRRDRPRLRDGRRHAARRRPWRERAAADAARLPAVVGGGDAVGAGAAVASAEARQGASRAPATSATARARSRGRAGPLMWIHGASVGEIARGRSR